MNKSCLCGGTPEKYKEMFSTPSKQEVSSFNGSSDKSQNYCWCKYTNYIIYATIVHSLKNLFLEEQTPLLGREVPELLKLASLNCKGASSASLGPEKFILHSYDT